MSDCFMWAAAICLVACLLALLPLAWRAFYGDGDEAPWVHRRRRRSRRMR